MPSIYFNKAIGEALLEEMEADESVVLIGEDIGVYGGAFGVTRGLLERFGRDRVIETPISENSFVGVAVGMATMGFKPVVEIMFMDFITLAMDQIVNHASKLHYIYNGQVRVPLVIRTPTGAKGGYGASHSQSLEKWFIGVPGLKVVAPSTPYEAKGVLKSAIRDPNPVLFLENKLLYNKKGPVSEDEYMVPLDKAICKKKGSDVTIIAYSRMVHLALEASEILTKQGVSAEVIDLLSLKPLDVEAVVSSVRKTGRAVIVEEGCKKGGIGAEVAALIAENCLEYLDGRIVRVGAQDVPIPASTYLEQFVIPNVQDILEAADKSLRWQSLYSRDQTIL